MEIQPRITAAELAEYLDLTVQAIHKRADSLGLKKTKSNGRLLFTHNEAKLIINPKYKQFKISTAVVKGGVGKTTMAEALAVRASLYGVRVLCVDLDQQANLTKGLGMADQAKNCPVMIDLVEEGTNAVVDESVLNVAPGLDLIPSRLDNVTLDGYIMIRRINPATLINKTLSSIFHRYDLIIFDCPPTLGSTVCAAMLASDLVIAPVNPDIYSYEGISIMQKEFQNIHSDFNREINWKILLNKFDSRTVLSTGYIEQLVKDENFSKRLLSSVIRASQEFPNTKSRGKTIFDSTKKSTAKEDTDAFTKEILSFMNCEPPTGLEAPSNEEILATS